MPESRNPTLKLDQESMNVPVSMQEQTRSQIAIFNGPFGGIASLESMTPANSGIVALGQNWHTGNYAYWAKVRRMRRHPTIKLVRQLHCACMASAQWSVETSADSIDVAKDIVTDLLPFQNTFLAHALTGLFDWGWSAFEKVFYWDSKDRRTKIKKLKPLLQDYTRIMVTAKHGKFAGFMQFNKFLGASNALLLNQFPEGTYLYGESTMSSIEPAYDRWIITDQSNVVYDKKIAGAHWVIHYPIGNSIVNGLATDNFEIAKSLLKQLESSGSIAVPATVMQGMVELTKQTGQEAWRIELITADTSQAQYNVRLQYLDAQMVRGGGFPERSILEGQYGTKAEAGEHADFAIMLLDFANKCVADTLNWHLVNQLLRMNIGEEAENSAWLKVAPIADDKKDFLKQLLMASLSNPAIGTQQFASMDLHAIRESLEIPATDKNDDSDEHLSNMLAILQGQNTDPQMPPQQGTNPVGQNQPINGGIT